MTPNSLVERLDTLERTVEALAGLPARVAVVDVQISQLRDGMRIGFSAVRDDIAQTNARMLELHEETTTSIGRTNAQLRALQEDTTTSIAHMNAQMRALHEETTTSIAQMNTQMLALHTETTTSIAQTNTQMRVLHEDVVSRIATLKEAPRRPKKHR
jgi:hypothetical protein